MFFSDFEIKLQTFQARQDGALVNNATTYFMWWLSQNRPEIKRIKVFSDGAGTYHCAESIVALPAIGCYFGVSVESFIFSEAQARVTYILEKYSFNLRRSQQV